MKKRSKVVDIILTILLVLLAASFVFPILLILMNSFKDELAISTDTIFKWPASDEFAGFENYVNALNSKGFFKSLIYSLFITVSSVTAICVLCAMCAWFITRVKSKISNILYYMFVFSMVVPFQMVMYTLSKTADTLQLNTPWNIWIIYLGFGSGLAVFMFC